MKTLVSLQAAVLLMLQPVRLFSQDLSEFIGNGNTILTHYSEAGKKNNPAKKVLTIFRTFNANSQKPYDNWTTPRYSHALWNVDNLGEVFGICTDSSRNIYVTSTSIYGKSKYGTGGAGGVYRLNASTGDVTNFAKLPNQIDPKYNYAPGLGNICFDKIYKHFFVTNLEDGKIYRLDYFGNVIDKFDPFQSDDSTSGFAPLKERIWGIGINRNKIYYGRYCSDIAQSGILNQIWSVQIDKNAFDTSTNKLELTLPVIGTNGTSRYNFPASDIEFSSNGRTMLVACKTMHGDMIIGNPATSTGANNFSHRSNLYAFYSVNGRSWDTLNYERIPIGAKELNTTNCAGGCDFAYFPEYGNKSEEFDTYFWSSGEGLHLKTDDKINGLQAIPINNITNAETSSIYIDYDYILDNMEKGEMGDVDVFKPTQNSCFRYDTTVNVSTSCNESKRFYFTIYNCGNNDAIVDTAIVSNNQLFKIDKSYSSYFTIKANGSVSIPITFSPITFGKTETEILLFFSNQSDIISTRILCNNENRFEQNDNLLYDFGNVQLGDSLEIKGFLRNNTNQFKILYRFGTPTSQFEITSQNSSDLFILAHDSIPFSIKYKPTKYGSFTDTIHIIEPICKLDIRIIYSGYSKPVCAKLLADSLNFRNITCVGLDTMIFKIINCGADTLKLTMSNSTNDFEILSYSRIELQTGDTTLIAVRFTPKIFGNKMDTLRIKSNTKGNYEYKIPMKGNFIFAQSRFSISETRLEYPVTPFGTSQSKTITIKNLNNYPVTVRYKNNVNNFKFADSSGFFIPALSSHELTIVYSNNGCEKDTSFVIFYLDECSDTAYLRMFGSGDLKENGLLLLGTYQKRIDLGYNNFVLLPIIIKKSNLLNEANIRNISFDIGLNSSMFLVDLIVGTRKFDLTVTNKFLDEKTLTLHMNAVLMSGQKFSTGSDTLGLIFLSTFPSEDTSGIIKFGDLKTDGCQINLQTEDSYFNTYIMPCMKIRKLVFLVLPKINLVSPNPASQVITAFVEHDPKELLTVNLIDENGKTIEPKFSLKNISLSSSQIMINTHALNSGVYTLIVRNQSGIASEKIIIKK